MSSRKGIVFPLKDGNIKFEFEENNFIHYISESEWKLESETKLFFPIIEKKDDEKHDNSVWAYHNFHNQVAKINSTNSDLVSKQAFQFLSEAITEILVSLSYCRDEINQDEFENLLDIMEQYDVSDCTLKSFRELKRINNRYAIPPCLIESIHYFMKNSTIPRSLDGDDSNISSLFHLCNLFLIMTKNYKNSIEKPLVFQSLMDDQLRNQYDEKFSPSRFFELVNFFNSIWNQPLDSETSAARLKKQYKNIWSDDD